MKGLLGTLRVNGWYFSSKSHAKDTTLVRVSGCHRMVSHCNSFLRPLTKQSSRAVGVSPSTLFAKVVNAE